MYHHPYTAPPVGTKPPKVVRPKLVLEPPKVVRRELLLKPAKVVRPKLVRELVTKTHKTESTN